jgi:hypothetical protein
VTFPSSVKCTPYKFVIEWHARGETRFEWEGNGPIHNRYIDFSLLHNVDTSLLTFLNTEAGKDSSGRVDSFIYIATGSMKAIPLVHWDDVRHLTIEQSHTSAFAKLLNVFLINLTFVNLQRRIPQYTILQSFRTLLLGPVREQTNILTFSNKKVC